MGVDVLRHDPRMKCVPRKNKKKGEGGKVVLCPSLLLFDVSTQGLLSHPCMRSCHMTLYDTISYESIRWGKIISGRCVS